MTAASAQGWTPGPDREARRRTADYARRRYQLSRAGQWAPFTDMGPVREHLEVLREVGFTVEQIGRVAGVSVATLRRAAKEPRMTSAAADAIMGIPVPAADPDQRPGATGPCLSRCSETTDQLGCVPSKTGREMRFDPDDDE